MERNYIIDEKGKKKGVLLSIEEYRSLIDQLETIDDIRLYLEAMADKDNEAIPWEDAKKIIGV